MTLALILGFSLINFRRKPNRRISWCLLRYFGALQYADDLKVMFLVIIGPVGLGVALHLAGFTEAAFAVQSRLEHLDVPVIESFC